MVKLCGNFLIAASIEAIAESMALAEKNQVDRKVGFIFVFMHTVYIVTTTSLCLGNLYGGVEVSEAYMEG
ncbi:hypothetical protein EON65_27025 [archaeon]|nr:MAG: hypothetical protein EON65_27025 [archaeon]